MNRFIGRKQWLRPLVAGLAALVAVIGLGSSLGPREAHSDPPEAAEWFEPQHFILVHGVWHGAWAWYKTQTQLENMGHTVTTVDLPGHGIDRTPPETVTLDDYVDRVVDAIDAAGEPVILVGHSMGGVVISEAAEARPLQVDKLVYLAAFLLPNGTSLFDIALTDTDSVAGANLIPGAGVMDINRDVLEDAFYEMSPHSDITLAESLVVVNPLMPIVTPIAVTDANYGSVPRYYIETTYDNAISPRIQRSMYTTMPCDEVFTIRSDHSPFFSRPFHLTWILQRIANR